MYCLYRLNNTFGNEWKIRKTFSTNRHGKLFEHDLNLSLSNYYEGLYNIKRLSVLVLRSASNKSLQKERKIVCFAHNTIWGERKNTFEAFAYFSVIFHTPSDFIAESYDKQKGKREIIDQEWILLRVNILCWESWAWMLKLRRLWRSLGLEYLRQSLRWFNNKCFPHLSSHCSELGPNIWLFCWSRKKQSRIFNRKLLAM